MSTRSRPPDERALLAVLLLVTLLLRLPFVPRFDLVSFDGTYYINQARALLHGSFSGGAFPIGYPLMIAPVLAVIHDGVLAAGLVSLLAALGSVAVVYALARRYVARREAAVAALMLAAAPLFIDASLATLSESVYSFWIVVTLWCLGASMMLRAGLSIGMAAATRPEALAIAVVLGAWRLRTPRQLAPFALGFLLVYGASVAALSASHGRLTLVSRSGAYTSIGKFWFLRDPSVDYAGREQLEQRLQDRARPFDRGRSYLQRLPREVGRLGRHMVPALPGLVLLVVMRRRGNGETPRETPWFILASLAPLPFIPLFTEDRGIVRWLVPYLAPLAVLAAVGLALAQRRRGQLVSAATIACIVVSLAVNQAVIGHEIERDMTHTRDVARRFSARVKPGDVVADRKPYFAFYSGARLTGIPNGPYDNVMNHLAALPARYISIHPNSVTVLRPAMAPLLYDRAAVLGEMRYRQVEFHETGEIVYEWSAAAGPLRSRRITTPDVADHSPAWSPDGSAIAFRRQFKDGTSAIMLVDSSGAGLREVTRTSPMSDALAWSPDGTRIAYASLLDGRMVLNVCDVATGRSHPVTSGTQQQWNPSWCRRTGALVFCADARGSQVVFETRGLGSTARQVSFEEPADLASISPSGTWISWVDPRGRLVLSNTVTGEAKKVRDPGEILWHASWSPDEGQVLVEAFDWGGSNVYMIDVASGRALRVTSSDGGDGAPAWSPAGDHFVSVSGRDDRIALWLHTNLGPYLKRLSEPDDVQVFTRPELTRKPPPPGARRFRDGSP